MEDEVYIEANTKDLVVNGKHYRFAKEQKPKLKGHGGNLVFKPVGKDYDERLERAADYLAKKSNGLTKQLIIKEALRHLRPNELLKLEKSISKKKRPIVEKGCVGLNMDGQIITLVDA